MLYQKRKPQGRKNTGRSLSTIRIGTLFLVSLSLFSKIEGQDLEQGSRKNPEFSGSSLSLLESFTAGDSTRDLRLKALRVSDRIQPDLYLDFDQSIPEALSDRAGYYHVLEASYVYSDDSWSGEGAALFNRLENQIRLNSPAELWPGNGGILDDFTIQVRIKPLFFYRTNDLFHKISFLEGKKRGLEILIQDEHIQVNLWNLFRNDRGEEKSLSLESFSQIQTGNWNHILLTYESSTGRFTLMLNGQEEQTRYAADQSSVWSMAFHSLDRSPIVVGSSFAGIMDEFALHRESIPLDVETFSVISRYPALENTAPGRNYRQKKGTVISPVLRPGNGRSTGKGLFHYRTEEPEGTGIQTWIRFSQSPFAPDVSERTLPWKAIDSTEVEIPPFSHFQWKAELHSDPEGKQTPVFKEAVLHFEEASRTPPPGKPEIVSSSSKDPNIVIQWLESTDPAVTRDGHYRLYYGLRPGQYEGFLEYRLLQGIAIPIQKEQIDDFTVEEQKLQTQNPDLLKRRLDRRVRLRIDNSMIERNIALHPRKRKLPFLKPGYSYYFAVSAISKDGGESILTEESRWELRESARGE